VPGTALPVVGGTEDPPSLSVFVMANVALALRVSVSVALTVEASEAPVEAVFERVPVAEELTVATTV